MKKPIKLLLLAALAWSGIAIAQGQVTLQREKASVSLLEAKEVVALDYKHNPGVKVDVTQFVAQQTDAESNPVRTAIAPRHAASITPVPSSGRVIRERIEIVADGTTTSEFFPIRGYDYDDVRTCSQMIYPSNMLTNFVGKKNKITDILCTKWNSIL